MTVARPQAPALRPPRRRPRPLPSRGTLSLVRRYPLLALFVGLMVLDVLAVGRVSIQQDQLARQRRHVASLALEVRKLEADLARIESLDQIASRARAMGLVEAERVAYFPPPSRPVSAPAPVRPVLGTRGAW